MMKATARLRWASFFAVCGLGYVLYVGLARRLDPNARPLWKMDRATAIAAVRDFASEQGSEASPAQGWWSRWSSERVIGQHHDEDVGRYLSSHPGTAEQLVRHLVPGLQAHAQLRTPAGDLFEVWLDPAGRRVGFRRRFPDEPLPGAPAAPQDTADGEADQERARELAWASLMARVDAARIEVPDVIRLQLQEAEEDRSLPGPPIYTFTWEGRAEELPELTLEAVIAVRDETRVSERLALELDTPNTVLGQVFGLGITLLILLVLAYTTMRLVRRAREGEVSRSRGFVLGGFVFVLVVLVPWCVDATLSQGAVLLNLMGIVISAVLTALGLAFFWIALEGDVREALPGKLTALDTLLSGRLLSRDVAWSTLSGIALAGPALALQQTTRLLPPAGSGVTEELADLFSARTASLALYLQPVVLWAGVLVFIPLSFLLRWTRSPKRALIQLAVMLPALAMALTWLTPDTGVRQLAFVTVTIAFILVPFLLHDLLACLWTSYVMMAAPGILYLNHQTSAALEADGLEAVAVAGLGLLGILLTLVWGRTYSAEEVRPLYAKNLAERLELLAERKLADEALDRLLPAALPEVPGATLAASCQRGTAPSGGTGGESTAGGSEFYDLLALPEDRLGIALLDLEGRGAAAALRLALLKGLLKTYSLRRTSPFSVFEGMQDRLQRPLGGRGGEPQAPSGPPAVPFAGVYAVYDPASRTLCYTRRGEAPALFLRRSGGEVVALDGASAGDTEVTLEPGDALVFASGEGVLAAAGEGIHTLSNALSGFEDGNALTLHASLRQLTTASEAGGDRTLVVLATAHEGSNRARDARASLPDPPRGSRV